MAGTIIRACMHPKITTIIIIQEVFNKMIEPGFVNRHTIITRDIFYHYCMGYE